MKIKKSMPTRVTKKPKVVESEDESDNSESDDKPYHELPSNLDSDEEKSEDDKDPEEEFKKSIKNLSKTDPELYKSLVENDKSLCEFISRGEDEEEKENSDDDNSDDDEDKIHIPQDPENPSDEEDFEADDDDDDDNKVINNQKISLKMVKQWEEAIKKDRTNGTIKSLVTAFHAALNRVINENDDKETKLKVDSSSVFNSVVMLCIVELQPAIKKFLRVGPHISPTKSSNWPKVRKYLTIYFQDLNKLISNVSSDQITVFLLKHTHQMIHPYLICFKKLIPKYVKLLTGIWSSAEESVRVLAFLCLLKLCVNYNAILPSVVKTMYLNYVRNSKFVSPNTLPGINFCRRSLTEIFSLNESIAYEHAFLYLRQLAIHLRNAITVAKKESRQAVYNWQFVNSLYFFSDMLSANHNKPMIASLIYPFVQIVNGTIINAPNAHYYPLRFHCCKMLIDLSKNTNTFIPILPFYLSILNRFDFNKKHSKVSLKPLDITCILRLNKVQLTENGFKDSIIENIYEHMLEYLTNESHRIAFPDLTITACIELRAFLKKCKIANYAKKMKHLLEKIEENSKFIETERKTVNFRIKSNELDALESNIQLRGTPLSKFYENWKKQKQNQISKTQIDTIHITSEPLIKYNKGPGAEKPTSKRKANQLLSSDEESEDEILLEREEPKKPHKKKLKTKGTRNKSKLKRKFTEENDETNEPEDIVEEMRLSDLDLN